METDFQKGYKKATLTFESDRITFQNELTNWKFTPGVMEVMMDWEQPIMEKMAELTVSEGDHVVECGFGMGILSDAIQARNPASHTVCESHPDIIPRMRTWAEGKSNVILHEDRWYTLIEQTGRYDAILMDTYADDDLHPKLRYFCRNKGVKTGCKVTWWNWSGGTTDEYMRFYWDDISFTDVTVDPPENSYYNRTVYKVPLKILTPNPTSYGVLQGTQIHYSASETKNIQDIAGNHDILTCADASNPTLATNQSDMCFNVKCKGVYTINDGLLVATGTHPMIIKRGGSWLTDKQMSELVVGDKLYKVDNTEVEITKIDFDTSDTKHVVSRIVIDHNYFANDILMRKEDDDG
jgi:hypothetical protein